jgi:hypothetical protein
MERRILLKRMGDRLVISAGRVLEIELLGALSVIEEDIVIAVYQHGEQGTLVKILSFGRFFGSLCFGW